MDGRLEKQKKTEAYIMKMIEKYPDIVKSYYVYLHDKTFQTKLNYMQKILYFIDYLTEQGFDCNNINSFKDIKPSVINAYMEEHRYKQNGEEYSETYRALLLNVVKSFFGFLENEEYIVKNPTNKIKQPKVSDQTSIVYLTQSEILQIKANMLNYKRHTWFERDVAIITLALGTGLRVSALTDINIDDINFDDKTIRVTEKENITKDVYMSKDVEIALHKWIEKRNRILSEKQDDSNNALFISFRMKRLSPEAVNDMLKKYTYNINKKITAHKLRSTFAMNVYEKTGDIFLTSELLGHSKLETTKRYATATEDKKRKAIDIISTNLL